MGNCCAYPKKKKSKVHSNITTRENANKIITPSKYLSLKVDSPFDHCNLLVWTETEAFFPALFQQTFYKHQVSGKKEMTFNISSYYTYSSRSPFVVDAMVFFVQEPNNLETTKEISKWFRNICIKFLVTSLEAETTEGFIKIPNKDLLWTEIHQQQKNLAKMLRELFTDIDTDFSNFITFEEFYEALLRLDQECSLEMARQVMKEIDKDNDGKISFNEFCYWWKRGRQGKYSILELTSEWADKIRYLLPKMNSLNESSLINRKMTRKKLRFGSKGKIRPKFSVKIVAGKSGKREEILHNIEETLSLNIYEFWVTFSISAKNEENARERLKLFEDTVDNLKLCLFSNSANTKFWEAVNIETCKIGEKIFISIIFDPETPDLNDLINKLDSIDKSLASPIDDFLSVSFKSDLSIIEMVQLSNEDLVESLKHGSLELNCEHWSAYENLINPQTDFDKYLKKFASIQGEHSLTASDISQYFPIHLYLRKLFSPFSQLLTQVRILQEALKAFREDFKQSFSIHMRYMNIGCEFSIEGEDLTRIL